MDTQTHKTYRYERSNEENGICFWYAEAGAKGIYEYGNGLKHDVMKCCCIMICGAGFSLLCFFVVFFWAINLHFAQHASRSHLTEAVAGITTS